LKSGRRRLEAEIGGRADLLAIRRRRFPFRFLVED
jgi:hypothetical protein